MARKKKVTSIMDKIKKEEEPLSAEEELEMNVQEDDESETFTIDFGRGLIFSNSEDYKTTWNSESVLSDEVKDLIKKEVESLLPESQRKLQTHLVSVLTEGGLRSLYRELEEVKTHLGKMIESRRNALRGVGLPEQWEEVCKKQQELRYCYPYIEQGVLSGTIDFKRIPEWALMYIQEYMTRCLDNLMSLSD